jgi:hypothetical protein
VVGPAPVLAGTRLGEPRRERPRVLGRDKEEEEGKSELGGAGLSATLNVNLRLYSHIRDAQDERLDVEVGDVERRAEEGEDAVVDERAGVRVRTY